MKHFCISVFKIILFIFSQGSHIITTLRPVEQLQSVLSSGYGADSDLVASYFQQYGVRKLNIKGWIQHNITQHNVMVPRQPFPSSLPFFQCNINYNHNCFQHNVVFHDQISLSTSSLFSNHNIHVWLHWTLILQP